MTRQGFAVEAAGLTKRYSRSSNGLARLWSALSGKSSPNDFRALDNIDLELEKGASMGIVGRNGSGKSTLLQIVCGTLLPTAGRISTDGRIGAMLELGAGFNPEFTGAENALLYLCALGLSVAEAEARMPDVERFADIGEYFDRPVLEYSSGMYARLAFAVIAHGDADILIVDEILGVGDAQFQKKCSRFMNGFHDDGGTMLFVSHDPAAVTAVCNVAIWLEDGKIAAAGPADHIVRAYTDAMYGIAGSSPGNATTSAKANAGPDADFQWKKDNPMQVNRFNPDSPRHGHGGCTILDCFFSSSCGATAETIFGGEIVTIHIRARADRRIDNPIAGFMFRDYAGRNLFGDNTYLAFKDEPHAIDAGQVFEGRIKFRMPYLPDGRYSLAPSVIEGTQYSHVHLDWREEAIFVDVENSPVGCGKIGLAMQDISVVEAGS